MEGAGWLDLSTVAPGGPLGLVEAADASMLRVGGRAIPASAVARVDPAGIYLHLASNDVDAEPRGGEQAMGIADIAHDGDHMVIPLAEERPMVTHRQVDFGEVIIMKRVIEETRMMPVTIRREILELVRRDADGNETIEELSTTAE